MVEFGAMKLTLTIDISINTVAGRDFFPTSPPPHPREVVKKGERKNFNSKMDCFLKLKGKYIYIKCVKLNEESNGICKKHNFEFKID